MNIRWHLRWLIVTGFGGLVIFGAVAFTALLRIEVNGPLYQQIALRKDVVIDYVPPAGSLLPAAVYSSMMIDTDPMEVQRYRRLFDAAEQEFSRLHASYERRMPRGALRDLMQDTAYTPATEYFRIARQEFIPFIAQGNRDRAQAVLTAKMKPLYEQHAAAVDRIVEIANDQVRTGEIEAANIVRFDTGLLISVGTAILLVGGAFSMRIARGISTQTEELQRSFDQLRALAGRLQSVREEERTRVAREIHDQLGQSLTAIKIDVNALVHHQADEGQREARRQATLQLVDETIQTVRRISTELRPGILDDLGLVATVEWAGEEFEARTGTACMLDLPKDEIAIDPERATALFRILQETLTNVARHAAATRVDVRLATEGGTAILEVRDNGRGMVAEKDLRRGSLGILGMRERATLIGGTLAITGAPGKGTTVRVTIPDPASRAMAVTAGTR